MERVSENALQVVHRCLSRIDWEGLSTTQIAKPPAVVQSHYMIGVRVGENDRVEPPDIFAQHLDAELGCGVHDQTRLVGFNVN